jgi:formylglycine-generating enzyme required for sulfatase activity
VRVTAPKGVETVHVRDVVRAAEKEIPVGEFPLPAGEYRLGAGGVDLPLLVMLPVRAAGVAADREPPRVVVDIPLAKEQIPDGMVLVLPGADAVEHRGAPWSAPLPFAASVRPFLMDRREVRIGDYFAFVMSIPDLEERRRRAPPIDFREEPAQPGVFTVPEEVRNLPVRGVSPDDAAAYCAWRSEQEKAKVRLPTEAEWVVAAGARMGWALPCGLRGLPEDGNLDAPVAVDRVREADRSPYGVVGLYGNVREIVTGVRAAPTDPDAFLTKGGGPGDRPIDAAILLVRPQPRGDRDPRTGFRCVRDF